MAIARYLQRFRRVCCIGFILLVALGLSGCIQYDVGIRFADEHHGTFSQRIQLDERLTEFDPASVETWVASVGERSRRLGGQMQVIPEEGTPQSLEVRIPFYSRRDLEAKFNEFFQTDSGRGFANEGERQPPLPVPHLTVNLERNLILAQQNRLTYDLDMRSLQTVASEQSVFVNPAALFEVKFSLTVPWGATLLEPPSELVSTVQQQGQVLTWPLNPSGANHVEAVFWVPSPLGIGTLGVVLLVGVGGVVKRYRG
ncbi:MAG: DUF3153 domain-containing protein [Synechococcales bacterium]|nr:DUF3153 domain-containing protein [Synechococcales bacterium]